MKPQDYPPELGMLIDSHGHLCPGLSLGYRLSKYALKLVDRGPGLTAYSGSGGCPLHAIEKLTGCSVERGNLIMTGTPGWAFFDKNSGEGFRFVLKDLSHSKAEDREGYIKLLLTLPDNDIFGLEPFNPPAED